MLVFFFSSRRRHTRWPRDWSSDVCSSDLLQSIATSLTPYVAADRGLNTGRITDLARSLRHVPADNIASCTLPEDITEAQLADLVEYFATGVPARCADLF